MKKNKTKKKRFLKRAVEQIKTHPKTFVVFIVLRILVIAVLILQLLHRNYENVFLCFLTLALFFVPSIVEMKAQVRLPDTLETIVFLFIFAAEILGEIQNFYGLFKYWDTLLHVLNGFLSAAIGFSMIDIMNRIEKFHINLSPLFVALVGFCFSMTIGTMWEFFEYTYDNVVTTDMQKDRIITDVSSILINEEKKNVPVHLNDITSTVINYEDGNSLVINGGYLDIGLNDTMKDLLVNFVGAITFCTIGYFYVKKRGKSRVVSGFMLEFRPQEKPIKQAKLTKLEEN